MHRCLALAEEVGWIVLALVAVVGLRMWEVMGEELARRPLVQAVQGEMMLAVVEEVLAEHCSLEVEEVEVMFLASWVAVEEALRACFAQAAAVGLVRDLEVEEVLLKARDCLRMEVVHQTCLPQAGLLPALVSLAAEEAAALMQHQIALLRGSVAQEAGWRTCRHLQWAEVL